MSATIEVNGLAGLEHYLTTVPQVATTSLRIALNQTAERKGITALRDAMEEEVAFPRGYLNDPKRFGVSQRATNANLEARIRARSRPTSLARFASGGSTIGNQAGGRGVAVRVSPQRRRLMEGAFLVRLRAGQGPVTDEAFNLGLAIRLKPGEAVRNKTTMVPFGGGLYLLYGPSVDQVFQTVAVDQSGRIGDLIADEFLRQLDFRLKDI
jgi:hypothetical protein